MTCRIQALPPAYVGQTKEEARAILNDPASTYSQRKLAWEFLRNEHKSQGPMCSENGILGYTNKEIKKMLRTRKHQPGGDPA